VSGRASGGTLVDVTVQEFGPRTVAARPGPAPWLAAVVLVWIPAVLMADRAASAAGQDLLGAVTWVLLLAVLWAQAPAVRAQTAVVVVFAAAVEYTFSGWLHVYVYRLHDVPAFVPPGHGLVYLAALSIGGSALLRRHARPAVAVTVLFGGAYAAWGLSPWAPRLDVLGAFWFCCLLAFLALGRSRLLYVGAFAVVTYLELLGTSLHIWTWAPRDPTGIVGTAGSTWPRSPPRRCWSPPCPGPGPGRRGAAARSRSPAKRALAPPRGRRCPSRPSRPSWPSLQRLPRPRSHPAPAAPVRAGARSW
jgi:hypothetical protein